MTPAELAARYRTYAAKCLTLAQAHGDASQKLALIDMAQVWSDLAEMAEKNESLFVVYETPAKPMGAE